MQIQNTGLLSRFAEKLCSIHQFQPLAGIIRIRPGDPRKLAPIGGMRNSGAVFSRGAIPVHKAQMQRHVTFDRLATHD